MTFIKNKASAETIREKIMAYPLFSGVNEVDLSTLIDTSHLIRFKQGERLNDEGDLLQYCPLILMGEIIVFRHTYQGTEKVFGIFEAQSIVALSAIFMPHNRYPMTLTAKTDGSAILLNKHEIIKLAESNLVFANRLLKNFSRQMYGFINEIDWITSSSAEERLAAYLLRLSAKAKDASQIEIPLSKSQLAVKLGIRQETLSRLLSAWKKNRVVKINGRLFCLHNMDYLEALALPSLRMF